MFIKKDSAFLSSTTCLRTFITYRSVDLKIGVGFQISVRYQLVSKRPLGRLRCELIHVDKGFIEVFM